LRRKESRRGERRCKHSRAVEEMIKGEERRNGEEKRRGETERRGEEGDGEEGKWRGDEGAKQIRTKNRTRNRTKQNRAEETSRGLSH
jgi:hypothetical protein